MKHKKKVYKALKRIKKECRRHECCMDCGFYVGSGLTRCCRITCAQPELWSLDKKTIFYNYESEEK